MADCVKCQVGMDDEFSVSLNSRDYCQGCAVKVLQSRLDLITKAVEDIENLSDSSCRMAVANIAHGQDPLTPEQQKWAEGVVARIKEKEDGN